MEKNIKYLGLEQLLKQSGATVDKVYIQKEARTNERLNESNEAWNINFSYVPVEKLNRLTPNNHQGAVATYLLFLF
jgi:23S rRNA (guanosine2251-2'-O)-methyltransferase